MIIDKFITALAVNIINPVIILLFAIALVIFIWGLVVFMQNAQKPDARELAQKHVLYGLIGMFIMMCAFGIITIFTRTFGIDTTQNLDKLER